MSLAIRLIFRRIKAVVMVVAIFFFVALLIKHRREVIDLVLGASLPGLLCAILLLMLNVLVAPCATFFFLRFSGCGITYRLSAYVFIRNLPLKYLPGGVWHTVGRISELGGLGMPTRLTVALVAAENFLPLAVAVFLGCLLLNLADRPGDDVNEFMILGITVGFLASIAILTFLVRFVSSEAGGLQLRWVLGVLATIFLFWLIQCLAFSSYFLSGYSDRDVNGLVRVGGAYLVAWSAGFVAIFAPQGAGVQEYVLSRFLAGNVIPSVVIVLAAGFRVVQMFSDLVSWLILKPCFSKETMVKNCA